MIQITTGRRIKPVDTISPRTTFINAGLLGDTRSQDIGDINLTLLQISQTGGVADQREIGIIQTCAVAIAYVTLILFVKQLLGSARPLFVLPGCCLGGAAFCLLCDLIARSLFAPTELSISAVTAVFGAPVVIWLLIRRNQEGAR